MTQPEDKCYIFLNYLPFCLILGNTHWKNPLLCTKATDSIAPLQTASPVPAKASWGKACGIERLKLDCTVRTHMSHFLHPRLMQWTCLPLRCKADSKGNKKWKLWGKKWSCCGPSEQTVRTQWKREKISETAYESVDDYLLDHLTETNQIMVLKVQPVIFLSERVDEVGFWRASRKMQCLQKISNRALAIILFQSGHLSTVGAKAAFLPLWWNKLKPERPTHKPAHKETACPTKAGFNGVLEIRCLQRDQEVLLVCISRLVRGADGPWAYVHAEYGKNVVICQVSLQ